MYRVAPFFLTHTVESVMQWPPSKLQAPNYTAWLTELMFYVPLDTKYVILETFFPDNLLA